MLCLIHDWYRNKRLVTTRGVSFHAKFRNMKHQTSGHAAKKYAPHRFRLKKLLFARRNSKPVMQLQRFAAIEKVQIQFDFNISAYV
jgi:hypothetical protein